MRKVLLILVVVIASGCGSSKPSSTVPPVGTPLVTYPIGTVPGPSTCFQGLAPCAPAAQFASACAGVGGYITNRFGPPVCELTRRYDYNTDLALTLYFPDQLPIITPSIPTGGVDTGIRLRKGAKLTLLDLQTGKWGYYQQSTSSFWGGRITFSWFSGNCQSIDWTGGGSSGQLTNEGQPAGLFGSDGVQSFYLGVGTGASTTVTIQNDGDLRLGINADPTTPYGCTSPGFPEIDLTTCEDASGNTYTC
jgi:hypothetical protein